MEKYTERCDGINDQMRKKNIVQMYFVQTKSTGVVLRSINLTASSYGECVEMNGFSSRISQANKIPHFR